MREAGEAEHVKKCIESRHCRTTVSGCGAITALSYQPLAVCITAVSHYRRVLSWLSWCFHGRLEPMSAQASPGDDIGPVSCPGLISGKGQHRTKLQVVLGSYSMSGSHLHLPHRASEPTISRYS